jgi:hypothetical protein
MPQARSGVLVPGQPSHTGGDQPIPVCTEAIAAGEGIHYAPFLSAVSDLILGFVMIGDWLGGGNFLKGVEEGRLVGFDLGEDIASCLPGGFKGLLLTLHPIAGVKDAGEPQFAYQRLNTRDLLSSTSVWARRIAFSVAKALKM